MAKPVLDLINAIAEWLFAGFTRITGTDIRKYDKREVYNVRAPPAREEKEETEDATF